MPLRGARAERNPSGKESNPEGEGAAVFGTGYLERRRSVPPSAGTSVVMER